MLYPDFLPVKVSLSTLAHFEQTFPTLPPLAPATPASIESTTRATKTHIYVCTHASRDCRCGELGEPLYGELVDEINRRGETSIQVSRIAHIGGHIHAANILVYRSDSKGSDWCASPD